MNSNTYTDPILERIRQLLEKEGPKELRNRYYIGEPLTPAKSDLPLCFIEYKAQALQDSSAYEIRTKAYIKITVAYDLTRDLHVNNKKTGTHSALNKLFCARAADMTLERDSILGVLINNQDQGGRLAFNIGEGVQVEYDYTDRGNGIFTSNLSATFTASLTETVRKN